MELRPVNENEEKPTTNPTEALNDDHRLGKWQRRAGVSLDGYQPITLKGLRLSSQS